MKIAALAVGGLALATIAASASDYSRLKMAEVIRPVSVVQVGPHDVLVAEYSRLRKVNLSTRRSTEIRPVRLPGAWYPTGVAHYRGRIVIANYIGKNVLIGRLRGSSFLVDRNIHVSDGAGPENVSASREGIAVADYTGNAVHLFGWDGALVWTAPLSLAHGVVIAYGHVYATSLGGAGVVKLRLSDGKMVAQDATVGWQGYLYPTAILAHAGRALPSDLAVVDANRGAVILLDRNLARLGAWGENSATVWNRPYAAAVVGGRVLVADTGNRRLVWLKGPDDVEIAFQDAPTRALGVAPRRGNGEPVCTFERIELPGVQPTLAVSAGFTAACVGNANMLALPVNTTALQGRPQMGFGLVWQARVDRHGPTYRVTGSTDQSIAMVARGDTYAFVTLPPQTVIFGNSVDANLAAVLERLVEQALPAIIKQDRLSERCGRLAGFLRAHGSRASTLDDAVLSAVLTERPRTLVREWLHGRNLADGDVDEIIRGGQSDLDGIAILRRIVGSASDLERQRFIGCPQN